MNASILLRGVTALSIALASVKLIAVLETALAVDGAAGARKQVGPPHGLWSNAQLVGPAQADPLPNTQAAQQPGRRQSAERIQDETADGSIATALRARREALDERERALAFREQVIGAAERRLAGRVSELTAFQRTMEAQERAVQERDEAGWADLARLYEAMRPRDAANIFNRLEMPILVQVVYRMGARRAAPVLAAMDPERARQLTTELTRLRGASISAAAAP
jgi:flagellar motility protein MotE (MotC chaperone)